jgi:flagellar motor switch protein FliM
MTAKLDSTNGTPARYDFQHPSRLSKQQVRLLDHLHSGLAKRLSISLSGLIKDIVEITVAAVEETPWLAFLDSIPTPCAAFMFAADPLEGAGIVSIEPGLAFGFIERLFGGKGSATENRRELTPIEQKAIFRVSTTVIKSVEFAWAPIDKIDVKQIGFVSNPEFIPAYGISEAVVNVRLAIRTNNMEGEVSVAYPYLMFEPLFRDLVKPAHIGKKTEPDRDTIESVLSAVRLPVAARLAPTMITMRHLVNLQEGDILLLDNHVSEDVDVYVGEIDAFKGRPGDVKGRFAVKVKSIAKGGGILNDL